jgi:hypothetical protein
MKFGFFRVIKEVFFHAVETFCVCETTEGSNVEIESD